MSRVKVDLHTHSCASADGGLSEAQYRKILSEGTLDAVAITDHNRVDCAVRLQRELGDKIIVGEEIMTTAGEIIGLFLTKPILAGLTPLATVRQIKKQGGLVYIPHPFETIRHGLQPEVLDQLIGHIDIVEIANGRAFLQNRHVRSIVWSRLNQVPGFASSDAHGLRGLGRTYTTLRDLPTRSNLPALLKDATPVINRPILRSLLYPKYHRLRKKVQRA